jgi:glycerol-3-phosphate dehydrogenase
MNTAEDLTAAQSLNNTKPEEFYLVILGGGTGSTIAAWTFAARGQRVAVIERKYIGGSFPNIACLPSKNIIHGAKVASYLRRSEEFGIAKEGFRIDMSAVRARKRKMVSALNAMYLQADGSGIEFRLWAVRRPPDGGSHAARRENSPATRDQCDRQHRHACHLGRGSWSYAGTTAHAYRIA